MTTELTLLAWTLVLAFVQIMLPAAIRNHEAGVDYHMGPRDTPAAPPGKYAARLQRAQANLFETLPIFIGAVLLAHAAGRENTLTLWGCWLYFGARVVYVPLYGFGVPMLRSVVWAVAAAGMLMVLAAALL
ncbi:MAG TPA: MAPEG family protein [Telluria sp.]|nr:MAPEG family protein [Telluria sp.]